MNENLNHHSIRSSLQSSLPTLPSGREITYDRCGNSNYNEFDADDEDLDEGYAAEGEDEAEHMGHANANVDDSARSADIQTNNGYEIAIEMDLEYDDDDENEDLEPNITTQPPIELMQQDDVSIHLDDDESEASRDVDVPIQKSRRSKSRESNKSYRSKSTTDSMEILNLPLSNEEQHLSINQLLGDDSYERPHANEQGDDDDINREPNEIYYQSEDAEDAESEWPGEDTQQLHQQDNVPHKGQKKLTPAKKRRRCILAISLLIFCLGTAAAGIWFVFYYLEDKRGYNIYGFNEGEATVDPNANKVDVNDLPVIHTIGDAFDSQCAPLTVEIRTDNFGNETAWTLVYVIDSDKTMSQNDNVFFERKRHADNIKRNRLRPHYIQRRMQESQPLQSFTVGTGGPYQFLKNSTTQMASHNSTFCLIKGSYQFNIQDANGDGFCCKYGEGSYTLYFSRGRVVHSSSFESGRLESIVFDVTDQDIDIAQKTDVPSISLTPSISSVPSIAPSLNSTMISSSPPIFIKSMSTASGLELLTNVSKSYGIMFDITTHRNISSVLIVGLDLLVYSTEPINYEVWTMSGLWRDVNTNETNLDTAFERQSNGTIFGRGVCEDCGFTSIPFDQFQNVLVKGSKSVQSFWVTLSSDSLVFKNDVAAQPLSDSFSINSGSAVLVSSTEIINPLLDLSDGKGFLGTIHYQSKFRDIADTVSPTPSPLSESLLNVTTSPSFVATNSSNVLSPTNNSNTTFTTLSSFSPMFAPTSNSTYENSTSMVEDETNKINYTIYMINSSLAPSAASTASLSELPSTNATREGDNLTISIETDGV